MNTSPIPIAIAVIWDDDRILIGLRKEGSALAGYWEFPGGKVEAGESHEAAVVRETSEETGLLVEVVSEYSPEVFEYDHALVALRFFRCQLANANCQPNADRFHWVTKNQLSEYRFPPANERLISQLCDDMAT